MLEKLAKDKTALLEEFSDILIKENKKVNLTRITEPGDVRRRHFEDSLSILERLELIDKQLDNPRLIDIGSGAGFPGIVLAVALENWRITSLEATGKKVDFQKQVIEKLSLKNIEAVKGRAEQAGKDDRWREQFDVVTCRAVGSLSMVVELGLPLLKTGGYLFAWKGRKVEAELPAGKERCKKLGGGSIEQFSYQLSDTEEDFRIVVIKKAGQTPGKYPREFKDIKKDS